LADIDTIVGVKQGSGNHADSLKLRREVRSDFIVSDPLEDVWWDDLRHGGQVLWGGFTNIIYGKKREVLHTYTKLAREGKWEEAYRLWQSLDPVRDLMNKFFAEPLFRTASYATLSEISRLGMKRWVSRLVLCFLRFGVFHQRRKSGSKKN